MAISIITIIFLLYHLSYKQVDDDCNFNPTTLLKFTQKKQLILLDNKLKRFDVFGAKMNETMQKKKT